MAVSLVIHSLFTKPRTSDRIKHDGMEQLYLYMYILYLIMRAQVSWNIRNIPRVKLIRKPTPGREWRIFLTSEEYERGHFRHFQLLTLSLARVTNFTILLRLDRIQYYVTALVKGRARVRRVLYAKSHQKSHMWTNLYSLGRLEECTFQLGTG